MEISFLWCSTQILSSKYHTLALWKESRKYHSSGQFEFMSGPTKHKNIQRKPHKNSGSIVNFLKVQLKAQKPTRSHTKALNVPIYTC